MGELVRRDDPIAMQRARQEIIKPAVDEAILEMHLQAQRVFEHGTRVIVNRVQAIDNPIEARYNAAFAEALIEQLGDQVKGLAHDGSERAREIGRSW